MEVRNKDWGLVIRFGDWIGESGLAFWYEIEIWDCGLKIVEYGLGIGYRIWD